MKSKTTQLAAASVLAIAIPLAPSVAHSAMSPAPIGLSHVKAFASGSDQNARRTSATRDLTKEQHDAVLHAVDSAIGASTEAIGALEAARSAAPYSANQAREDLQDAITALQAAAAEATYVLDSIPADGIAHQLLSEIRQDMRLLQDRLV